LEELRETETPGRRGGEFIYARAVYAYFREIEELKAEGFTLATICRFLEKREILPAGSDPRSFCRAFRRRREAVGRKRE
jgi:DNA-binding transcriptional MerR regulator